MQHNDFFSCQKVVHFFLVTVSLCCANVEELKSDYNDSVDSGFRPILYEG